MALVPFNRNGQRRHPTLGQMVNLARGGYQLYRSLPSFNSSKPSRQPTAGNVSRIIRASHEPKNLDALDGAFQLSTTTWTPVQLNNTSQGSNANERTGRQVLNDYLELRCSFVLNTGQEADLVRLICFVDKECRGAQCAYADVFQYTATFGQVNCLSPFNFDNVPNRFRILSDHTFAINTHVAAAPFVQQHVIRVPLNFKTHFYNTNNGTIADVDSGSIQFAVIGSVGSSATTMNWNSRVVFRDI